VTEVGVRAERAKEGILKRIFSCLASQQADEVAEDLGSVRVVEALEGRDGHRLHHPV
jgi:hypothetical protein